MGNRRHKRLAAMALAGAGLVLLLHFLKALTPVMLTASALCGAVALVVLFVDVQGARGLIKRTFRWIERRLPTDERG